MFNKNKKDGQKESRPSIVTRETFGVTLGVFSVLILLISFTGSLLFGDVGTAITSFLFGVFGFMTYFVFAGLLYLAVVLIAGRNFIPGRLMTASGFCLVALIGLLVHAAVTSGYPQATYGEFLAACFAAGEKGAFGCSPFGLIGGIVTYPFTALASPAGAYILFSAGIVLCLYLFVNSILKYKGIRLSFGALRRKESAEGKEGKSERERVRPVSFSELENDRTPQTAEEDLPYGGSYGAPAYNEPPAPSYNAPAAPRGEYGQNNYYAPQSGNGQRSSYADRSSAGQGYPVGQEENVPYGQSFGGRNAYGESMRQDPSQNYRSGMSAAAGRKVLYGQDAGNAVKEEDYSSPDRSKKILYGSGNPADYRNRNLIFDTSSHYNNRPQTAAPQESDKEGDRYGGSSYTDMYSKGIDGNNSPSAKPREIVREDGNAQSAYSMYKKDVFGTYDPAPSREETRKENGQEEYMEDYGGADESEPIRPSYHAPVDTSAVSAAKRTDGDAAAFASNAPTERAVREDITPPARGSVVSARTDEGSFRPETDSSLRASRAADAAEFRRSAPSGDVAENEKSAESGGNMTLGERFRADRERQSSERAVARQAPEGRVPPAQEERDEEEDVLSSKKDTLFDGEFGAGLSDEEEDDIPDFRVDSRREISPERGREGLSSAMRDRTERGERTDRLPDRGGDRLPPARESVTPPARESAAPVRETPPPPPKPRIPKEYVRPTLDIFNSYADTVSVDPNEIEWNKQGIVETLEGFNISVEIANVKVGPSFTRYDINCPKNVTVKSIARCADNIAMTLHAVGKINVTSNFSQGTISIEVPNRKRSTVGMRNMLQADAYINAKPGALAFCIGKDIEGSSVCGSLAKMTHLLVAGATGSGKSVFLNELIISLIMKYSPEEMRLILIDPKQVEFAPYSGLPNLMINEIIADVNKVIVVLNWAINEMEHRYTLFGQMTASGKAVRNIDEYNAAVSERTDKLPKIVIIVDELADLMSVAKKDIEERIGRLAAKARAAGMHLVLATQRPSVDVITGVLKSNLPSRFAFRVSSEVDSRVILDEMGAENLLGAGDLLYKTASMFSVERVQGAWLDASEIQSVCDFIRSHNEAYYDETATQFIDSGGKSAGGGVGGEEEGDGEVEPVYIDALRFVVQSGSASISMIQRKCSVGYNKAGKIIEWMEMSGYISPFEGAKSRKVLLTADEFREKYGEL